LQSELLDGNMKSSPEKIVEYLLLDSGAAEGEVLWVSIS